MEHAYASLSVVALYPQTTFERPPEPPELVHLDSPALEVMTDFEHVHAVATTPETSIDDALECMKTKGVRMLLVLDDAETVVGVVTAKDIQGERPIKIVQEHRTPRSAIKVSTVMTPQAKITALNLTNVRNAQVGHIVQTLHDLERQHIFVVDFDETGQTQRLRGLFSTSQIARQLGSDISEAVPSAHSLAEIQHEIG